MNRIKVLMVTGSLHIGGMESVAMNIARYSDHDRFSIDFLVYGTEKYEHEPEVEKLGGKVIRIPFPHETPLTFVRNIRRVIRQNNGYDIVHCHNLFNCGFVAKAAYLEHVPVRISHSHTNRLKESSSFIRRKYEAYMRKLMLKYSTEFYACSVKAGKYLFGDTFERQGVVLKNGVFLPAYHISKAEQQQIREQLNLDDCKVIGQIGTLNDVKNHKFSLQIMENVLKVRQDVKLLIVGDGELYNEISNQIHKMGLSENVLMIGKRSDVPLLLGTVDVFLMPSLYEGVSVALVEAQAAGLPCVVSSTACAPEVHITDQIMVLPLECGVEKWTDAVLKAMEHEKYTGSAERIVSNGFSVTDAVGELNRNYQDYLEKEAK